jgi:cellobiose-specific phosphotransferase system component IIA
MSIYDSYLNIMIPHSTPWCNLANTRSIYTNPPETNYNNLICYIKSVDSARIADYDRLNGKIEQTITTCCEEIDKAKETVKKHKAYIQHINAAAIFDDHQYDLRIKSVDAARIADYDKLDDKIMKMDQGWIENFNNLNDYIESINEARTADYNTLHNRIVKSEECFLENFSIITKILEKHKSRDENFEKRIQMLENLFSESTQKIHNLENQLSKSTTEINQLKEKIKVKELEDLEVEWNLVNDSYKCFLTNCTQESQQKLDKELELLEFNLEEQEEPELVESNPEEPEEPELVESNPEEPEEPELVESNPEEPEEPELVESNLEEPELVESNPEEPEPTEFELVKSYIESDLESDLDAWSGWGDCGDCGDCGIANSNIDL